MDGSAKILLIEDDPEHAKQIGNCLLSFGTPITIETSGAIDTCVEKVTKHSYEAIIFDSRLSEHETKEILGRAVGRKPATPIIMITDQQNKNFPSRTGELEYIVRESGYLERLCEVVQRTIEKSQLERRLRKSELEKKELFDKILLSKNRLQNLFDGINDIIYEVTPDYKILLANKKCAAICNTKPGNLIGRNCHDILFDFEGTDQCLIRATIETLEPNNIEAELKGKIFDVHTYPILNSEGKLESIAVHAKDITQKKKLEKSLIQSEKLATIGLLASGIAHELRNPLNVIETARYYIDEFLPDKEGDIKAKLEIISKNVKRASKIINNLLEFSRDSGSERESVDLYGLIESTTSLIKKELDAQNIQYSLEIAEDCFVLFNADSLKQVLLNVIVNAIQAMPNGGELNIKTTIISEQFVELTISDSGVGIVKEHRQNIFTPFFTTKDTGTGTGLGLYITHQIIEKEGGQIWFDSQPNVGTTFTLKLPVGKQD